VLPFDEKPRVEAVAVSALEEEDEEKERDSFKKKSAQNLFSNPLFDGNMSRIFSLPLFYILIF